MEREFGKFSSEGAIRLEQLNNSYNSKSVDTIFKDNYLNLLPSLKLSYSINGKSSILFSLNKGINRPAPNRLNPFPDLSDPFNISIGNPDLNPEIFYNYELGIKTSVKRVRINFNLFYTKYNNIIQRIKELRGNVIAYTIPFNLDSMKNYGFDFNFQFVLAKWWNQNLGGLVYRKEYVDERIMDSKAYSSQFKAVSTLKVSNNLSIEAIGNYSIADNMVQGELGGQEYFDLGLEYEFLKRRLKISINFFDVFNTLEENLILLNGNFEEVANRKNNTRRLYFTVNYKL